MTREPIRANNGRWYIWDRQIVEVPSNNPAIPFYKRYKWYWRELIEKPILDLTGYPVIPWVYELGFSPYYFSKDIHGFVCCECGKIRIDISKEHGRNWWNNVLKTGRVTKDGDIIVYDLILPENLDEKPKISYDDSLVFTTRKFIYRDYCSEKCYKKARNNKQRERRKKERENRYAQNIPEEIPNGFCKVCKKDISDKRAGALTCCNAHRKKLERLKEKRED